MLCLFGLVVNTFPFDHLTTSASTACCNAPASATSSSERSTSFLPGWKDKVALAAVCLVGYWALMRFVPVPGFGVPTHDVAINDMNGNLTAYIDRLLFAPQHLYEKVRDPEGLLSTIPAIRHGDPRPARRHLAAHLALHPRQGHRTRRNRRRLRAWRCVVEPVLSPVNKKLWTSSFVLFAGGFSLLLLALAIYITDIKRIGRHDTTRADAPEHPTIYKPLLVFGTNSIAAYMVSELLDPILRFIHTSDGNIGRSYALWLHRVLPVHGVPELLFGLTIVLITWLVVLPLYRKRIFLRI